MAMEKPKTGDFPVILEALGAYFPFQGSLKASNPPPMGIDRLHRRQAEAKGALKSEIGRQGVKFPATGMRRLFRFKKEVVDRWLEERMSENQKMEEKHGKE